MLKNGWDLGLNNVHVSPKYEQTWLSLKFFCKQVLRSHPKVQEKPSTFRKSFIVRALISFIPMTVDYLPINSTKVVSFKLKVNTKSRFIESYVH